MTTRVLILAGLYDFSADLVTLRLQEAGVPYVRLNREQLADHRLTLDPLVPELTIRGPAGTHVVGQDLSSVWFRRPVFLRNTPSERFLHSNSLSGLNGLRFSRPLRLPSRDVDELTNCNVYRGIKALPALCGEELWP